MSLTRSPRYVAALLVCAVLLASCGKKDPLTGSVVSDGVGCKPEYTAPGTSNAPSIIKVTSAPTKLATKDLKAGTGCPTTNGAYLSVQLLGATALDAKVFRSSWSDGRPATLQLGKGQLLKGLEVGLTGMKVGGRRQIIVPADQAYGKAGNPSQGIGPNQPLEFVVDLIGATDTPRYCNPATSIPKGSVPGKPTTVKMPIEAPQTLKKTDLTPGTGKAAKNGSYVVLNYIGVSCATGQQFDSSWDRGQALPVTVGSGTIQGFSDGIIGIKPGGLRQIDIPAAQAYGAAGKAPIGANDPLTFIIQAVSVADKAPATTTTAPAGSSTTTTVAKGSSTTTTAPG